jgi:HAD superfamily hydrolase (TIGR01549 family)
VSPTCFAVDLVTFDIGGTLLTFRPDQVHEWVVVLDEIGIQADMRRIEEAIERERPRARERRLAEVPADHRVTQGAGEERRRQFFRNVLRGAGVSPERLDEATDAIKAAFDSPRMYVVYDDALPTLRELWMRGLKLAAISNTWPSMPRILKSFGFDQYLGYWVMSEFVGIEKPAAEIFERALEIGASRSERAVHVGDDYQTDVVGAQGVGMRCVLLDRSGRAAVPDARDVVVIQSLDQLLTLIG